MRERGFFKTSKEREVIICMKISIFELGRGLFPFFLLLKLVVLHFHYFQITLLHLLVLSVSPELGHSLAFCSI